MTNWIEYTSWSSVLLWNTAQDVLIFTNYYYCYVCFCIEGYRYCTCMYMYMCIQNKHVWLLQNAKSVHLGASYMYMYGRVPYLQFSVVHTRVGKHVYSLMWRALLQDPLPVKTIKAMRKPDVTALPQ